MAAGDTCANCKHVGARSQQTPGGTVTILLCHRNPPTVHAQFFLMKSEDNPGGMPTPISETFWPVVRQTDRCGEHVVDIAISTTVHPRKS